MRSVRAGLLVVLLAATGAGGQEVPRLGLPLTAGEARSLEFTVLPNGEGLPAGSGSVAAGKALYERHCGACHAEGGAGGPNDRLAGGHGSIGSPGPVKTLGSYWPYSTTVFDYIRKAMPFAAPGTLTDDDVYALTAYLLHLNDIVGEDAVLDRDSLPGVRMPNRDGFVWAN